MNAEISDEQFLLRELQDEGALLHELENLLGFPVDSVDRHRQSSVFALLQEHDDLDYRQSVLISWRAGSLSPVPNFKDVTGALAVKLGTNVILQLDNDQWVLSRPNGEQAEVFYDLDDQDADWPV